MGDGSGAKEHVDARPVMLFLRPEAQVYMIALNQDVMIGRGDIDRAVFDFRAVLRMNGLQGPRSCQYLR
jgi:hypothetical protein